MKSHEIRAQFLDFFGSRDHAVVPSSSLIPANDPTLFFTNAGMVQFKDVFTGQDVRDYSRATTVQKCLRVSGKHNDLENVGRTPRHHTFFEMLGNFSFGDYFKKEAIAYAWELLTGPLGLNKDRLWVTIFEDDDEAWDLWRSLDAVPVERIQRLGAKENFWAMGDTGPCGPCSEIHWDHGPQYGKGGGPAVDDGRFVEIWNLVFMQYQRSADGTLTNLPRPSIDTGAGLERVAAAVQGVYSNYDTDCFGPIIGRVADRTGVRYGQDTEADVAVRVIADHARAAAFLVADGVMPSNEERGYVLRRVMRRAIRYGVKLGMEEPFLFQATDAVVDHLSDAYPDLSSRREFIREVVKTEEERFSQTLSKGLSLLEGKIDEQIAGRTHGRAELPGEVVFRLYDTFGFPLDLTRLIAAERNIGVDEEGYRAAMEAQRALGRAAWKGSGEKALAGAVHELASAGGHTEFTGYTDDSGDSEITALLVDDAIATEAAAGQIVEMVVRSTPFYAESGGQTGDTGTVHTTTAKGRIIDTRKPTGDVFLHKVEITEGTLKVGDAVHLDVDAARRDRTRLNHTATHLLHSALRTVLGEHVTQKGSLVGPDRLRFDFAHHKSMTDDEVRQVEDIVFAQVLKNTPVETIECSLDEARARGAMALFGEKYGSDVRVVDVAGFSTELCGGNHARRTGDIGMFRITSESGVAAGVRRIEGATGLGAMQRARSESDVVRGLGDLLRTGSSNLVDSVARVMDDRKRLERELDGAKRELARATAGDLTTEAREIDGVKVLCAELAADPSTLRDEADRLRDTLGSAVVVLGSRHGGSVKLVVTVSKDLAGKRFHAGKIIKQVAGLVGGGGGGRPDMAQAGGKNADALPSALEKAYDIIGAA